MASKGILGRKLGMTQVWDDEQPGRSGDGDPGRALSRRAAQDPRARRLRRGPARLRRSRTPATSPRPSSDTSTKAGAAASRAPRRAAGRRPLRLRGRPGHRRRPVRGGRAGRRHRHQQGQGLHRRDEAPQLLTGRAPATATTRSTAPPARSAPARRRHACSRACAFPASTATARSRRSTSRSSKPTPSAASCSLKGRSPARPAASCSSATR